MYQSARRRRNRHRRLAAVAALALLLLFLVLILTSLRGESAGTAESGVRENGEPAADDSAAGFVYTRAVTPATEQSSTPRVWREKPDAVKGIYVSGYVAGTPALEEYVSLVEETELNAMVIDVKEVTGELMYRSEVPLAQEIGSNGDYIEDLPGLVADLNERGIYTIARIPVFEDDILPRERPDLAILDSATGGPWVNTMGTAWANPHRREVWEYNVGIAREAAAAGFDEIQWDYVRFPSDGPMDRVEYGEESYPTQEETISAFLEYAYGEISPLGVYVAADVFGMIASTENSGIGQRVPDIAPHVDVLCPMPYPSHYPPGSYGFDNPNAQPYAVLERAMSDFHTQAEGVNPDLEIRTWIQDFDWGHTPYGPAEVRAQMQAVYDSGETGWLLWNAANEYTREALEPAE